MVNLELPFVDAPGSAVSSPRADRTHCAPFDSRDLSHELRTPLNAILGNTELLLDGSCGPLSAQARACLSEIHTAARQLLRQAELLLAWQALRSGGSPAARCQVDLVALVRETWTSGRADPLQVEPRDASLPIWGEPAGLRMLVVQIVALDGARGAAAKLKVETGAAHHALRFAWPGSGAGSPGGLQIALIGALARVQGAELAVHSDGVSLLWSHRPDGPQADQEPARPRGARATAPRKAHDHRGRGGRRPRRGPVD